MSEYQSIHPVAQKDAEAKLNVVKGEALCSLLLAISELDDVEWVENVYLEYIHDDDQWVSSAAITGLGHLARISGQLNKNLVIKTLTDLAKVKSELKGKISDAISDIEGFIKD